MKMNIGDVLVYRDSKVSGRYGTGVVVSVANDEYTILWSYRGSTRYRRAIIDQRLNDVFQRIEEQSGAPRERQLNLGAPKGGVAFNENYSRVRLESLCEKLKLSETRAAQDLANGLTTQLFTKKLALRGGAKVVLLRLAELCAARSDASGDAKEISKELFFGYVLQKSDFAALE